MEDTKKKNRTGYKKRKKVKKDTPSSKDNNPNTKQLAFSENSSNDKDKKLKPHVGVLEADENEFLEYFGGTDAASTLTFDDIQTISSDVIVKSYMNKLLGKSNAIKRSWDWGATNQEVIDFIKNLWNNLDWNSFNRYVFSSKYYGYSVIQIVWENVDVEVIGDTTFPAGQNIVKFKQEDPRNFGYNRDKEKGEIGDLMYLPTDTNFTVKYPYNFIVIRNNPDFSHEKGQSDVAELKPLVLFKNLLLKIKARYFRRSMIPAFIALYKSELVDDALRKEAQIIAEQLAAIENAAGVALPNVDGIEQLLPNRQVEFETAEEIINKQIAIRILGTDLLSATSKSTYASAKVGTEQFQDAVRELALILQEWNNIIIKFAVFNRYGTSVDVPQAIFDMTEKFDIDIFKFMMEAGIPVSWEELAKTFPLPRGMKLPKDDVYNWGNAQINTIVETAKTEEELKEDADRKQREEEEALANA